MMLLDRPASDTQVTHGRRLWLYAVSALIMIFLVAPTLIVVPMSFSDSVYLDFPPKNWSLRWYETYFSSVVWREATYMSIKTAILTVLVATPLGTAAAYGLHVAEFRLKPLIYVTLAVPMIVPLILVGIGAFFLFARLDLLNTLPGLVLAHSCLAIPFVIISVAAGLRSYDMNQELVARSLGASRLRAFLTVTLPQIRFSIVSGMLFAFITSFDEVIVALFIAGGESATITRRMFTALRDQIEPTIAAISTCLVLLSVVLLVTAQIVGGRKRS